MGGTWNRDRIPEVVPPASLPEFSYDAIEKGDRIGTGGDADIYEGTVEHDGRTYPIAVKQPRFEGTISTSVVERFQEEAETWTKLDDHANIVSVYAYGTDPLPWMALEYMDGGPLEARIGECTVPEALWLGGRIAEAVRHGHRHGVAHLDLKPTNVLLRETPDDTWPVPKVSDWGLAKMLLDHSSSIEGISPTYAAPEQFDPDGFGAPNDVTDIYQLGAVVYALLAGRPPFTGTSTAVMQSVLTAEPDPPSAHNPAVPEPVDEAILKALCTEKQDRYEGVLLFRRRLDSLFEEQVENTTSSLGTAGLSGATEETVEDSEPAASLNQGSAPPKGDPTGADPSSAQRETGSEIHAGRSPVTDDRASASDTMSNEQASREPTHSTSAQERAGEAPEQAGSRGGQKTGDSDSSLVSRRLLLGMFGMGAIGAGGFALTNTDNEDDIGNGDSGGSTGMGDSGGDNDTNSEDGSDVGGSGSSSIVWTDDFEDGTVNGWQDPNNTDAFNPTESVSYQSSYGAYLDYASSQKQLIVKRDIQSRDLTSNTSLFFRTKATSRNNAWILRLADSSGNEVAKIKDENPAGKVYNYGTETWVPSSKHQIGHDGNDPAWNGIRIDFNPGEETVHVYEENPDYTPILDEEVRYNPSASEEISSIEFWNKGTTASTGHRAAGYFDDFSIQF